MASTIKAGNATDGVQISSDATGALDIKTGAGAGTTAISIDASQNVAIPGTLTIGGIPAGGNYVMNAYTSPGTWDADTAIAAGLKAIKVTVVGAGGGTSPVSFPGNRQAASGGGASIKYYPAPSIPGPQPYSVSAGTTGPGGTSSFGAAPLPVVSATGGTSGALSTNSQAAGGTGSGGDINVPGGSAGYVGPASAIFNVGGASLLGTSPTAPLSNQTAAKAGQGYGSGASGNSAGPGPAAGANGAPGVVIIEEFY